MLLGNWGMVHISALNEVLLQLRPILLQDYFGTILGTISSTTNNTKIVPETSEKNGVF